MILGCLANSSKVGPHSSPADFSSENKKMKQILFKTTILSKGGDLISLHLSIHFQHYETYKNTYHSSYF